MIKLLVWFWHFIVVNKDVFVTFVFKILTNRRLINIIIRHVRVWHHIVVNKGAFLTFVFKGQRAFLSRVLILALHYSTQKICFVPKHVEVSSTLHTKDEDLKCVWSVHAVRWDWDFSIWRSHVKRALKPTVTLQDWLLNLEEANAGNKN